MGDGAQGSVELSTSKFIANPPFTGAQWNLGAVRPMFLGLIRLSI